MPNEFTKYPAETYPIGMDYTGKAPSGAILVSGVWSAIDMLDESDVSSSIFLSTSATIAGMVAKARVRNGELDRLYRLGITATFDTGDVLHDNVYMTIQQDA